MMANKIYTAKSYARLYKGQEKPIKAIKELLPYVSYNGLSSNLSLLKLLNELLAEQYSDEELVIKVNEAKSSLVIKDENTAFIKWFGVKIQLYDDILFDFNNPEFEVNAKLTSENKWHKVFDTNMIFKDYIQ